MPVVACPKCATNLRVADGAAAAVRCPKCKTVFTPVAPPAFEVVDASPPPPPKSAPKPAAPEPEFDVLDDEPALRKRRSRDDDDADRPRGKRRRGRRRDFDDDYGTIDRSSPFRRGKMACLLLSISIWLYMGAFGVMTLFGLLGWVGAGLSPNLYVLPGLAGLGNWIVGLVGLGFAVAGPRQGKGLAIAALSVAGVHFVLLIVCFTNRQGPSGEFGGGGLGGMEWSAVASMIPAVDDLLSRVVYGGRMIGTEYIFEVLAGGCEIARLILILLMIQAFARAARDGGAEDKAGNGVMVVSVTCGVVALVVTLVRVIVSEGKLGGAMGTLFGLTFLGSYTAHTLMLILPGMAAVDTKDALDRRG